MATRTNNSVIKAFAVLRTFKETDEWLSCTELCLRARLPIASGHRLLQTLERVGAVIRGPQGRYKPGVLLVSLSRRVSIATILRQVGHQITSSFANRFDLTAHIGVLEDGMVTYVVKTCGKGAYPIPTQVGSQLEAYCSGLGKVLLSSLAPENLESFLLDGELVPLTVHTITSRAALRVEIDRVRKAGWALDEREAQLDVVCIAVPIFDNEDRIVAALSASDDATRMTSARRAELRAALRECADKITQNMFPLVETLVVKRPPRLGLVKIAAPMEQAV